MIDSLATTDAAPRAYYDNARTMRCPAPLTAESAIRKLRAHAAARDEITAGPRTTLLAWIGPSVPSDDDAPATLRSGV